MALRSVILTGTAQLNILVGNVDSYESVIQQALEYQGFSVNTVRITKQTLFTNQINISIDCNVNTQYTGEQVRISAEQVLSNISGQSWAYPDSNLLSNVNLQILSDGGANIAPKDTTSNDAVSKILNGIGNAVTDAGKQGISNLTGNVTTPVVIGVVLIAGFLFFGPRRK